MIVKTDTDIKNIFHINVGMNEALTAKFHAFFTDFRINPDTLLDLAKVDLGKCQAMIRGITIWRKNKTTGNVDVVNLVLYGSTLIVMCDKHGKPNIDIPCKYDSRLKSILQTFVEDVLLGPRNQYDLVERMMSSVCDVDFSVSEEIYDITIRFRNFTLFNIETKTITSDVLPLFMNMNWRFVGNIMWFDREKGVRDKDIRALGISEKTYDFFNWSSVTC